MLILMTAVLTFFGGVLLARGYEPGLMATLGGAGARMAAVDGAQAGRQTRIERRTE